PATAESAAVESTETAAAAKSSAAAKTCRNLFAGRSKNHRHANAGKRDGGHLFQARNIRHERATLLLLYCLAPALAETVAEGIFCSSGGNSGVNTDAAIRGAKSQSLKIALNCGSAELFLYVMRSLQGTGCGPLSIQICQSMCFSTKAS